MARKPGRPAKATGAETVTRQGYVLVKQENGTWVNKNRVVMSEMLKRPLKPWERVIHKNGDLTDYTPENLTLEVSGNPTCPHCGKRYYK